MHAKPRPKYVAEQNSKENKRHNPKDNPLTEAAHLRGINHSVRLPVFHQHPGLTGFSSGRGVGDGDDVCNVSLPLDDERLWQGVDPRTGGVAGELRTIGESGAQGEGVFF